MRNTEMDILKGLGILIVVIGHIYEPFTWFPPYSFHMALFIFISGYFYKPNYETDVISFIKKRFISLAVPYFYYNIFFCFVTIFLLYKYNLSGLGMLPYFSLHNLFVEPFISGHQFHFFLAGWFVIQLLITQIIFLFLYKFFKKINNNLYFALLFFAILSLLGVYLGNHGFNEGWKLLIGRTLFSLGFFYLGYFYKEKLASKQIFNSYYLFVMLILQIILIYNFKDITYIMVFENYRGHLFLPIIVSINGIYLFLFISRALSKVLPGKDILITIGQKSFHILANHLFVFFLINFIYVKRHNLDMKVLNNVYYRFYVDKNWIIYVTCAIILPLLFALTVQKIRSKLVVIRSSKALNNH